MVKLKQTEKPNAETQAAMAEANEIVRSRQAWEDKPLAETVSVEATIANAPNAADPYTSWDMSVLDGMESRNGEALKSLQLVLEIIHLVPDSEEP